MDVGHREKFSTTCLKPPFAVAGLAFGAVAVTTAVIGDGGTMSATGALIDMAAEQGRAAACNGEQDLDMRPADPLAVALDESYSCGADQIGHL